MNKASLSSEYCENVEEELRKTAIEEVSQDMEEIIKHFNLLSNHLLNKKQKEKAKQVMKCKWNNFMKKFMNYVRIYKFLNIMVSFKLF